MQLFSSDAKTFSFFFGGGLKMPPCHSGFEGPGGKCTLFIGRWRRLDLSPFRLSGFSDFSKEVGFPAGLSRPGKSREGPGTGQDRT